MMPELIRLTMEDAEPRVRKEASWAVANAAHSCSDPVLHYLVDLRAIEALCMVHIHNIHNIHNITYIT